MTTVAYRSGPATHVSEGAAPLLQGTEKPSQSDAVSLEERAEEALEDLGLLRIIRHGHLDLATRAWELRRNVTAYDAAYLALAESLDAPVVTCDRPFGAARGHSARIEVIRPIPDGE